METLESEYIHFKIEQEYWKDRKDWSSYYERYFESYDHIFVKYSDWYDKQKSPSLETLQGFLNERNRIQNKIWEMENFEEQLSKIRGITKSLAKTIAKEYNYDREKIGEAGVEGLSKINGVGKTMAEEIIKRKVLL